MIVPTPMGSRWPRSEAKLESTVDLTGLPHYVGYTVPMTVADTYGGIRRDGLSNSAEVAERQGPPAEE